MRRDEPEEKSVYGRNIPVDEDGASQAEARDTPANSEPEKGTGETLDDVRRSNAAKLKTGGMGRPESPKDGPSQGEWHSSDDEQTRHVQKVPQNEKDTDQIPD
jgi:hypothetical protein